MQILTEIVQLPVTLRFFSCDQQHSASNIDPQPGLECF